MDAYDVLVIILIFRLVEIIINPFVKALVAYLREKMSEEKR